MQKGDSAKLKLLLAGISARLTKNRDFFVQADCTLVSGKKKFDAKLSRADEDYTLHFQGSDRRVDAAEFCTFFAEQAEKYDESVLTYTERSTVVTLSVTARGVQMKQAEREATAEEKAAAANPLLDSGRQYLIRVDQAAALLREIGILTADGKLKNDMIRKYNQIDHYVELVAPMFEQDDSDEIVLLDCACGKSYLSFVMNYYIHEVLHRRCRVIGVDIKEHVIDESRAMAKRLGYHNMGSADVPAAEKRYRCDFAARVRHCDRPRARYGNPRQGEIHRVRAVLPQGAARSVHHARPRAADQIRRIQGALQRCADRQHACAQTGSRRLQGVCR